MRPRDAIFLILLTACLIAEPSPLFAQTWHLVVGSTVPAEEGQKDFSSCLTAGLGFSIQGENLPLVLGWTTQIDRWQTAISTEIWNLVLAGTAELRMSSAWNSSAGVELASGVGVSPNSDGKTYEARGWLRAGPVFHFLVDPHLGASFGMAYTVTWNLCQGIQLWTSWDLPS